MWDRASLGIVFALVLCVAPSARADNTVSGEAERLVREGLAHYEAGEYPQAAEALERAYTLQPVSRILFNIARAHEKAGAHDKAIVYYERYIERSDAEPSLAERSRASIDELRHEASPKAAPEPATPPASAARRAETAPRRVVPQADSSEGSVSPWRVVGWTAVAVGAATAITGFVLDTVVLPGMIDDFETARTAGDGTALDRKGDVEGMQTGVLVTYIAGGVLAAGGLVLVLTAPGARAPSKTKGQAGVSAWAAPSGGGVGWSARF